MTHLKNKNYQQFHRKWSQRGLCHLSQNSTSLYAMLQSDTTTEADNY
jgi:hypothetical protein